MSSSSSGGSPIYIIPGAAIHLDSGLDGEAIDLIPSPAGDRGANRQRRIPVQSGTFGAWLVGDAGLRDLGGKHPRVVVSWQRGVVGMGELSWTVESKTEALVAEHRAFHGPHHRAGPDAWGFAATTRTRSGNWT